MERAGLFSSADFGVTFMGQLGPALPDSYTSTVSKANPGRYGSFSVGVYNGGGYNAVENNKNKAFEARISVRPLPSAVPGLQISYFGVTGKGNIAQEPDWKLNAIMGSYESVHMNFSAQWVKGKGNGSGSAATSVFKPLDRDGWSIFADGKFTKQWHAMLRYDHFDPNKDVSDDVTKRTIFGVAYFLNSSNLILVDYDRVDYEKAGKPADDRFQTTLQVSF